ncbi:MAG: hypothetical protein KatS3mg107_0900 [Gemmataceae bacterium]|nr:MAG: hypothetical protein KatS3mg107_0900 [Gemmataceae bacterium]
MGYDARPMLRLTSPSLPPAKYGSKPRRNGAEKPTPPMS